MKYILTEYQLSNLNKFLLKESVEIPGCKVLKDKNLKEFCYATEKIISNDLGNYTPKIKELLKSYFTSDGKIVKIQMEELSEESPMVLKGFEEISEVVKYIKNNCPDAVDVSEALKKKWMSKYNIYFKDESGNYHLLNRLDTNYTAIAVLITIYYENLINQVRQWTHKKSTPVNLFVLDWIEHFFNPSLPLIDPRKGAENNILGISKELEELPNPITIFNTVLKTKEFVIDDSDYHKSFIQALKDVRKKGFKTEDFFENMLKENNIEYKRYSRDFSFVDMVLGIDFLIKQKRRGEDYWIPVQVKSTFNEQYNLVDKFKCTIVIKPELIKIKGKEDFKIGDVRGFEEYFCEQNSFCKAPPPPNKKEKFRPSSYDYLSSKEFLEK